MLCFELYVNDQYRGRAGFDEGVMSAILTWGSRSDAPRTADINVGGLSKNRHYTWWGERLNVGDEVRIRVVESDTVDEPHQRAREARVGREPTTTPMPRD